MMSSIRAVRKSLFADRAGEYSDDISDNNATDLTTFLPADERTLDNLEDQVAPARGLSLFNFLRRAMRIRSPKYSSKANLPAPIWSYVTCPGYRLYWRLAKGLAIFILGVVTAL